jgi:hypothetical protein
MDSLALHGSRGLSDFYQRSIFVPFLLFHNHLFDNLLLRWAYSILITINFTRLFLQLFHLRMSDLLSLPNNRIIDSSRLRTALSLENDSVYFGWCIRPVRILSLYNFFDDFLLDYFFLAGDLLCDLLHAIESVRLLFLVTENVE